MDAICTTLIEGILFWGERRGRVAEEELEQISMPPDSIVHLLRHFTGVPPEWKAKAVQERLLSQEELSRELAEPGSKWNQKIEALATPEQVIQFCGSLLGLALQQERDLLWLRRGHIDLCLSSHEITPDLKTSLLHCDPEEFIGTQGLVKIERLPSGTKLSTTSRGKEGKQVTIAHTVPPLTNRVIVTLARRPEGIIQIWSAFPGILTPPFPSDQQDQSEKAYSQMFWGQYALVQ